MKRAARLIVIWLAVAALAALAVPFVIGNGFYINMATQVLIYALFEIAVIVPAALIMFGQAPETAEAIVLVDAHIRAGACDRLGEARQALRQHQVEESARFARLHHRGVNPGKRLRRFRHRVGQRQEL